MSNTTWDEIIGSSDSEHFVGRKNELSVFANDIARPSPNYLVYFIYGQGGVGKSELLKHYKEIAEKQNIIIVDCDERQGNIPSMLYRFASQLKFKGYSLNKFLDKYNKFLQLKQEIENDPDAPIGLASFAGQSIARIGFSLAEDVPIVRQGIKLIDQESIANQAGEWAKYLTKKWSNKHDEIALIKDPAAILSSLFITELNDIAYDSRIILCFDNYEFTRDYLDTWLNQLREYKPSKNIRLIIACRTAPGSAWEGLNNVLKQIHLDVFSLDEANEFLDLVSIKDMQRRKEILEFSGRLPVLMSWLSSPDSDSPDPVIPTAEVVDRFLRWVTEPELRVTALESSVPHFFNIDILSSIFDSESPFDIDSRFEWLRKQPFIKQHNYGWQYHSVVRRLMLHYQSRRSIDRYQLTHRRLADHYKEKLEKLHISKMDQLTSEHLQEIRVEYVYHHLMEAPNSNWNDFISEFVLALKFNLEYAQKLIALMSQPASLEDLDDVKRKTVNLIVQQLPSIIKGPRWNGINLYDHLSEESFANNSEANAHLYFLRGEATRVKKRDNDKAYEYLNKAVELDPMHYLAITEIGELLISQDKYAESIPEFDRALKIVPTYHYAQERKGVALYAIQKYKDALTVLNTAHKSNDRCASTLAYRGACYLNLNRINDALADLNRCLEIDPKNHWALLRRGEANLASKYYDQALKDFEGLGQMTNNYEHERLKNIGLVLLDKKAYEVAGAKFIEALRAEPACTHCWKSLLTSYEGYQPKELILELFSVTNFPDIEFTGDVYLMRSFALSEKNYSSDDAYRELSKAIKLKPELKSSAKISTNDLGLQFCRDGNYEEAIDCFELDNTSPDYVSKYNIAIAMILWKGTEVATREIQSAEKALLKLKKDTSDTPAIITYGFAGIEAAKNNKEKALSLVKEAIEKDRDIYRYVSKTDPAWKILRSDQDVRDFIASFE